MASMMRRSKALVLAAVAAVMTLSSRAVAALPAPPEPISDPDKPYMAYVIALVLVGCVCAVAFKPSKRTHLD